MIDPQPIGEPTQTIDKTMSITAANLWANLLALPVIAFILIPYALIWGDVWEGILRLMSQVGGVTFIGFVFGFALSIVLHELLHAIGFMLGGARWADIQFGLKMGTPFAHCRIPLPLNSYRLAVILPGMVLGVIPAFSGLIFGSLPLTLYGTVLTIAAMGDALILWLLRDAPLRTRVLDHPSKVGCELIP